MRGGVRDVLRYDRMVEQALRGVVREALAVTATRGLPGEHHFFITFQTKAQGVVAPDHLAAKYPEQITIVLQHQFWDLDVREDAFSVTLSFHGKPERVTIPFAAITDFADPAAKFTLQFQTATQDEPPNGGKGLRDAASDSGSSGKAGNKTGEVVTLDSFRKK
jgi:uncharacterized protein